MLAGYTIDTPAVSVSGFRGGLVSKAHRLVYHSTLGWRVIKKKKKYMSAMFAGYTIETPAVQGSGG